MNADREKLQDERKSFEEGKEMKAALNKMKKTPGYTNEDAIDARIASIEYRMWTESITLKVEKKLLAEIADLNQLHEEMNSDIAAAEAAELEHVDPEQVAEKEQAASQAETGANLAKQAAVSKKQAALREAAAAEEQRENCGEGRGAPS